MRLYVVVLHRSVRHTGCRGDLFGAQARGSDLTRHPPRLLGMSVAGEVAGQLSLNGVVLPLSVGLAFIPGAEGDERRIDRGVQNLHKRCARQANLAGKIDSSVLVDAYAIQREAVWHRPISVHVGDLACAHDHEILLGPRQPRRHELPRLVCCVDDELKVPPQVEHAGWRILDRVQDAAVKAVAPCHHHDRAAIARPRVDAPGGEHAQVSAARAPSRSSSDQPQVRLSASSVRATSTR